MVRRPSAASIVLLGIAFGVTSPAVGWTTTYEVTNPTPLRWESVASVGLRLELSSDIPLAGGSPELGWRTITIPEAWPEGRIPEIVVLEADTLTLPGSLAPRTADWITSDTATPPQPAAPDLKFYGSDTWHPEEAIRIEAAGRFGGVPVTSISWCPTRYNPARRQLVVIRRVALVMHATDQPLGEPRGTQITQPIGDALGSLVSIAGRRPIGTGPGLSPVDEWTPGWVWPGDTPLGVSYVVITGAGFVDQMRPLVEWKARRGIAAGLATVEAITAQYPAVDAAASVQAYLQDAYGQGLEWVVLAGDETVVPIRYAYAGWQPDPGDPYNLQICDLYFGEFDGDWDTDGDGIFGEIIGDDAELYPEIYVGRLPFTDETEATTIVAKIIAYESGPADSDYLLKALHVSADQMRDWSGGRGQHAIVAEAMPAYWTHDLTSMIEDPSGDDLQPVNPEGWRFPELLAEGAGWVNYYVHGSLEGFIVRSPGILQSPRVWVRTDGSSGGDNGSLSEIAPTPRPGIHVSAACDQGAFDLDSPLFGGNGGESVCERLLFTPQGGAVAFIGQSRWGWVGASYKLIRKFYEYVADEDISNHIGIYQTLAKLAYTGYRDLNFGNNLYGDPEMPVWKDRPASLEVVGPTIFVPGVDLGPLHALTGSQPVPGVFITLATGDSIWFVGETDATGTLYSELPMPDVGQVILTASKAGHRIWSDTVPVSIIADVFDDEATIPDAFDLSTNFPNPFNAGTILPVTLPASAHVSLVVYNILGQPVRTLIDHEMTEGSHQVPFDATDNAGHPLGSGVYFARLISGTETRVRKMLLLR